LRLSEHEAYNRIEAARISRRYPQILALMREGGLTLTAVRLLAPVLSDQNVERLLAAAAGCSKRGIEELVAREAPQADVTDRVRKLPARTVPMHTPSSVPSEQPPAPPATAVRAMASPRRAEREKALAP